MFALAGPLISGGVSLAGSLLSNIFGSHSQDKTNENQMKLAEYQYSKALEMWNRNNEYNTPSAQRERMEAAGFNPNLVYGHGSVVNTSSSYPQYSAPTLQAYTQYGNYGQAFLDGIMAIRKNSADVKKTEAEAKDAENKARISGIEADNAEEYGHNLGSYEHDIKLYDRELKSLEKEREQIRSQYYEQIEKAIASQNKYESQRLFNELKTQEKNWALMDSNIALNEARTGLTEAQTDTEKMRPSEIASGNALRRSQTALNYANIQLTKVEQRLKGLTADFYPSLTNTQIDYYSSQATLINNKVMSEALNRDLTAAQIESLLYKNYSSMIDAQYAERLKQLGIFKECADIMFKAISVGTQF